MLDEKIKSVVVFEPDYKIKETEEDRRITRDPRFQEEDDCDYFLNYTKLPYNMLYDNTEHLNTLKDMIYYCTRHYDYDDDYEQDYDRIDKQKNGQTKRQRHLKTKTKQDINNSVSIQKYTSLLTYRHINTPTYKHIKILTYIYNIVTSNFLIS